MPLVLRRAILTWLDLDSLLNALTSSKILAEVEYVPFTFLQWIGLKETANHNSDE
jgi:hypothetical protein